MTPYYQDEYATLYLGDAREVLPALPPVDLVLTDPPYGVGKASWDSYLPLDWMHLAAPLAPVVAVMPGTSHLLSMPDRVGLHFYRWTLAVHLVNGMTCGKMGYCNWFPCLVYAKADVDLYTRQSDAKDVVVGGDGKPDHPSPKPLAAMRWLVKRLPGERILDPFAGSGTTLVAAKEMGRNAIGIEIHEPYAEIAAKRLEQGVLEYGDRA